MTGGAPPSTKKRLLLGVLMLAILFLAVLSVRLCLEHELNRDSDGDGLPDMVEVNNYGTNPVSADSDGDGLSDMAEVVDHRTNPLSNDTDGDGLDDRYEILVLKTDPLRNWRVGSRDEDSLRSALNMRYLSELQYMTSQIEGNDTVTIAWNVLQWVDENIEYNETKRQLIESKSNQTVLLQTPYETVAKGSGVCSDYALLTAGLLLMLRVQPVYILGVNFTDYSFGHSAVAVDLTGEYFVLDQNLPVMHIGAYYRHWLSDNMTVDTITPYSVMRSGESVSVTKMPPHLHDELEKTLYRLTADDPASIEEFLSDAFTLRHDTYLESKELNAWSRDRLECIVAGEEECGSHLPKPFSKGRWIWYAVPTRTYHPKLARQFVTLALDSIDDGLQDHFKEFNRYGLSVGIAESYEFRTKAGSTMREPAVVIVLVLAR